MEFTMSKSKMVIGVALVAIGLGVAFEETIQTRMYTYMHSSMHDRHSTNGMGHDIKNMPGLRGANASQAESVKSQICQTVYERLHARLMNL